jgi:hypothetical protein
MLMGFDHVSGKLKVETSDWGKLNVVNSFESGALGV